MPRVIVVDAGVDAALVRDAAGVSTLVLRPGQTFGSACRNVRDCLPGAHPDEVAALVRKHLPGAPDLDGELRPVASFPNTPAIIPCPNGKRRGVVRSVLGLTGAVTALLLAGGVALVVGPAGAPQANARAATVDLFQLPAFQAVLDQAGASCAPLGGQRARCVDTAGLVMLGESARGASSVIYTFSYARDRVVLRMFDTEAEAAAFTAEAGVQAMQLNEHRAGRYVIYGTNPGHVSVYLSNLQALVAGAHPTA